jgi:hypothetical protein
MQAYQYHIHSTHVPDTVTDTSTHTEPVINCFLHRPQRHIQAKSLNSAYAIYMIFIRTLYICFISLTNVIYSYDNICNGLRRSYDICIT